jgi:predicted ATPase/DNA-binding transcriptional LysR family regulator
MQVEARLRAFAAVARQRSFSRAAEELFVSQPAVSKHVASLEAELGKQLVVRDRRAITLTPAGEVLADYVLRAEALLANAQRALASDEEAQTGTLAFAASGVPGTYLLPSIVADFHAKYPAVEIDFQLTTSGGALELVRTHTVELAVVGGLTVPPELESEPLVEDEVVLVGPARLAGRRLRAKELEDETWISREEGSATRAALEAARWQVGLRAMRTLELPSWEAVKLAVAGGAGIAAMSRFALDPVADDGRLAVLDVPRWRLERTISLVTARDVPLTPPAERFRDLLVAAFLAGPEAPPNSNLPAQTTSLLGREPDLTHITGLLRDEGTRLVTLTGAGGSGKTRLAIEAAGVLVDELADGVYLVELAALREPELVPGAIATVLGVPAEELDGRLESRELLLVLDNLEQVLEAAEAIASLLETSAGLRILATSRVALRIAGEHVHDVEPLELEDAVALFEQRARAVRPGFTADPSLAAVCERLDMLPLAIELAAARVKTLPPAALADRLEQKLSALVGGRLDADPRHRTLRATIDWSVDLLGKPEQAAFARLSVFEGGSDEESAQTVCDVDGPTLEALVDDSLLVAAAHGRFRMLELIRERAVEELAASGDEAEYRRRHADRFLALAREAQAGARGPEEPAWLRRLILELDNLRAALRWSLRADPLLGLKLATALEPLWIRGDRQREGLRWLEPLLSAAHDAPRDVLAGALAVAGRTAIELGDVARASPWQEQALVLARQEGDEPSEAWALHGLGRAAMLEGDLARARELFEESLALFRKLGELGPAGGRLTYLASVATEQGDLAAAERYWHEARESFSAAGDSMGVTGAVHGQGDVALEQGEPGRALALYAEALDLVQDLEWPRELAYCLAGIAAAATREDGGRAAAQLWGAALRLSGEVDVGIMSEDQVRYERILGELEAAEVAAGGELTTAEAVQLARSVAGAFTRSS